MNNIKNIKGVYRTEGSAHAHNTYQILYIYSGNIEVSVDLTIIKAKAPCVILLNCFEKHKIVSSSSDYGRYVLELVSDIDTDIQLANFLKKKKLEQEKILNLTSENQDDIGYVIEKIYLEYNHDNILKTPLINSFVTELLVMTYRLSGLTTDLQKPFISKIQSYVEENFKTIRSLDQLCSQFKISESHLIHSYKKLTGYSPMSYVLYSRLSYSARLLATTDMSVQNIAIEAGYDDINNFIRQFKSMYKYTPKNYRIYLRSK